MKKFLSGLIIGFLLFSGGYVFAQGPYPEPKGYVNDFANIIPDNAEQRLEQTLRDYEAKTTNEIAVVTVPSLQGLTVEDYAMGLAEKWKVGKDGKDNGVILLVAPNERAVRIEVGYGLEPVLTDGKAKLIIERVIIPEFKKGDFTTGIEKGTAEIIKTITPPVAPTSEAGQNSKSDSGAGIIILIIIGVIALITGFIAAFVLLGRTYNRWQSERKRKERVRQETVKLLKERENYIEQILDHNRELGGTEKYPAIIIRQKDDLIAETMRVKQKATVIINEARSFLKKSPDTADARLRQAESLLDLLVKESQALTETINRFNKARGTHQDKLNAAKSYAQSIHAYLVELRDKGYRVPTEELSQVNKILADAQMILEAREDIPYYPLVIELAGEALYKAEAIEHRWLNHLNIQSRNAQNLNELSRWREEPFEQLKVKYRTDSEQLKAKTPSEVWEPVIKIAEDVFAREFILLVDKARDLNGMANQEFEKAAKIIENIQLLKEQTETALRQPAKTLDAFKVAQKEAKSLSPKALGAITQAETLIHDPNAEGYGVGELKKAKEKFQAAQILEKSDLPNWLLIASLLMGALSLTQTAEREAGNRVKELERARRRREEEQKRRKDEEERRRSYHSSSSWSSGSSYGGGGGGFGGFGGGSFGGGGASGHW